MARTRKSTSKTAAKKRTSAKTTAARASRQAFTCPECGRTFGRAAALGAHRRRAHGVVGATAKSNTVRGTARRPSRQAASAHSRRQRAGGSINRDELLQTLFPTGVPAREDVIRAVNAWLDEAERLAAS